MGDQQQFCLRWNNHGSTLVAVFDALFTSESLVDVTLFCEGKLLKAHKVVLSACSPYFQKLFAQTTDKHPIVILKDVKHDELKALLHYMYKGEVNVSQEQLGSLIKTAESLKIKGLADGAKNGDVASSKPTPAPSTTTSTENSAEIRNGRLGMEYPPSTMASVLNTALTMPSNLSLSPHIRLPVPQAEPITRDNHSDGESSPLSKKRKKMRRKSGGTPDSNDSDVRSSGSPTEGSVHPFPRIPATITPLSQIQAAAAALHPIHREQLQMLRERELERERERARDRDNESESGKLHIDITNDSEAQMDREQTTDSIHEPKRPSSPSDNQVGSSNIDGNINPPRSSPMQLTMRPTSELLESTPTKQPKSNESFNHGYSSDANHLSDNDDDDGSSSDRAGPEHPDGAGPSTSHLNFGDSPHTPGYLGGWPYVPADHSQSEDAFNPLSENTNQDHLRAYNLLRAGFPGPLPRDIMAQTISHLGLPLLLSKNLNRDAKPHNPKNVLGYPFADPPKQFACEKCGRTYASTGNLKRHKKYECGVEPQFSCPICHKKFQHRHSVKIHVFSTHRAEAEQHEKDSITLEQLQNSAGGGFPGMGGFNLSNIPGLTGLPTSLGGGSSGGGSGGLMTSMGLTSPVSLSTSLSSNLDLTGGPAIGGPAIDIKPSSTTSSPVDMSSNDRPNSIGSASDPLGPGNDRMGLLASLASASGPQGSVLDRLSMAASVGAGLSPGQLGLGMDTHSIKKPESFSVPQVVNAPTTAQNQD